jgi:hypothetical protein
MLSTTEHSQLSAACRDVPVTENRFIATDFISTLCDTVLDYQQHTTTVVRAIEYFNSNRWDDVRTLGRCSRTGWTAS